MSKIDKSIPKEDIEKARIDAANVHNVHPTQIWIREASLRPSRYGIGRHYTHITFDVVGERSD